MATLVSSHAGSSFLYAGAKAATGYPVTAARPLSAFSAHSALEPSGLQHPTTIMLCRSESRSDRLIDIPYRNDMKLSKAMKSVTLCIGAIGSSIVTVRNLCFDTVDEPKSDGGADATKVNVSSHRNVMKVCGDGTSLSLYTDGIRSRGAMLRNLVFRSRRCKKIFCFSCGSRSFQSKCYFIQKYYEIGR